MEKEMITSGYWDNFLTLNDEKLLLVKRRHPFVLILPAIFITFLILLFMTGSLFFFTRFLQSIPLLVITICLLVSIFLTSITKCIMDWYFHIYILTTRKILEVWYAPLYTHVMNDVMLDMVRCTEVDVRKNGLFNELLDIGDVILTFDRPTHQEEFVFKDIQHCYRLGRYLTQKLMDRKMNEENVHMIWVRQPRMARANL